MLYTAIYKGENELATPSGKLASLRPYLLRPEHKARAEIVIEDN